MKHIFTFSLLVAIVFSSVPVVAKEVPILTDVFGSPDGPTRQKVEDLDGRDVVVRLYNDWKYTSAKFEKVTLTITGRSANLGAYDTNDAAVVVIIADDQYDAVIEKLLGNYVYKRPYSKALQFSLPSVEMLKGDWWTFNDALGNPITNADVKIFLANYDDPNLIFRRTSLDDRGQLEAPISSDRTTLFRLVISHPDYGIAIVVPNPYRQRKIFNLPLVTIGIEASEQSIWGTVVESQGNPVPNVLIESNTVMTPAGRLITSSAGCCRKVLTDEKGRFRFHLPVEDYMLIPPNSKYDVFVKAPKQIDLLNHRGRVLSGRETTIVLEQGQYLRTFVFEDANGPITDPDKLWYTGIDIKCLDGRYITITDTLYGRGWKNGKRLPLGTYYGRMIHAGKTFYFEPIEITADSPQQLVFKPKLPDTILYQGQVVHGITGEPMPGAFIIATERLLTGLGSITPQQWRLMRRLAAQPLADDPALKPLRKICNFEKLIRTDQQGRFRIAIRTLEKHFKLVGLEQDYLATTMEIRHVKLDENNLGQVPAMRIYPGAKVIIEPYSEENITEMYTKWCIVGKGGPDWLSDFQSYQFEPGVLVVGGTPMKKNEPQVVQVPAGVDIQIRFAAKGYRRRWCPIFTGTINVKQGQTLDLGCLTIEPEVPIHVQVIDSTGNPIIGIAVAHMDVTGRDIVVLPPVTDANGIAKFMVPPYYKARFSVGYRDKHNKYISESITYETNGPQDANSIFTLQVSDKMLYQLFK